MEEIQYSIIIPVYNSQNSLQEMIARVGETLRKIGELFEIILVNDSSQDNSWQVLQELRKQVIYPLKLINLAANYGQHKALLCGMGLSKGKVVILIDDDLQTPPEEIPKLLATWKEKKSDVVYGVYPQKQHSIIRNFGSDVLTFMLKKYGASPEKGSSFKLINRRIVNKICQTHFEYVYLDEMIGWFTKNIAYIPVVHQDRLEGKSGYSFLKLLKMTFQILLNYTAIPLRIMVYGGMLVSMICFMLGSYYLYQRVVINVPLELGFTSIIVAITFGVGVIISCIGIIGEYIRRLYFMQLSKPSYLIKDIIE